MCTHEASIIGAIDRLVSRESAVLWDRFREISWRGIELASESGQLGCGALSHRLLDSHPVEHQRS